MKTPAMCLMLVFSIWLSAPAAAQDRVAGTWQVESVAGAEPPQGAKLTMTFANAGRLTLTYTLNDQPLSWDYTYSVEQGRLTMTPVKATGEPESVSYDLRFSAGRLELLPPKPAEPEPTPDETGDDESTEEQGEDEAEEDTREPVWVLVIDNNG